MFEEIPKARSDFKAGTLYAIWGIADWIYYCQVAVDKSVAFFLRRDRKIAASGDILVSPIMSRIGVNYASVGGALRSGAWKKLGKYPLRDELGNVQPVVQWPVGTLDVTVWIGRVQSRLTRAPVRVARLASGGQCRMLRPTSDRRFRAHRKNSWPTINSMPLSPRAMSEG
jgi:hypothetical protein